MPERADKTEAYRVLRARESEIIERCRVTDGGKFRLKDYDPADTAGHQSDKPVARALLEGGVQRLAEQQEKLYAQDRWAMLCCFQAMDAAGKDSTIKHVMSGVNPQGVQVTSFKAPGPEELGHDFLWRMGRCPRAGVSASSTAAITRKCWRCACTRRCSSGSDLPPSLMGKRIWAERLEAIAGFERYLAREGWVIQKFFLHISKEEQKRRFLARLNEPEKNWKFSAADLAERGFWDDYMAAYEEAIAATAAPHAPWFVVPADNRWFARLVVVAAINQALDQLDLEFPKTDKDARTALDAARAQLEGER